MARHVNYSGLVIAGVGFFLTRFTVVLAIYEDPLRFYLAGVVPLALGLGLAAFGVALAVADVDASLVRTTALWCVIGVVTMLVLVVLTLLGSTTGGVPDFAAIRSRTYLSNFLIGGSVGGTLTGLYASRNRRQRVELQQQTNRLAVLNRILRHEVLNAVTVIRGYATLKAEGNPDAESVILEHSDTIERTIEEVKYLARSPNLTDTAPVPVDLGEHLAESVSSVSEAHPDVDIALGPVPDGLSVRANDRLGQVFVPLLENAAVHAGEDSAVEVSVTETSNRVRVSVSDDGPGLPESQQTLLEAGDIAEFDNPGSGFGLNVVRLLVEDYGGEIETDVGSSGTTITVALPRANVGRTGLGPSRSDLVGVRPAIPHLVVTLAAAVVAGVFYGVAAEQLGGSVGFIGVYYGVQNAVVGWITHEFHSVVFAFVFAGLVSLTPAQYRDWAPTYPLVGLAWGLVLWVAAAGVVSPIWLQLLGIPASIPTLSPLLLVTHVVWGISLGVMTVFGYTYVAPWLAGLGERLPRGHFDG